MTSANPDPTLDRAPLDDAMTGTPIPFYFIEYLCETRGIEREYALELVGTYLITRSAAAHGEAVDLDTIVDLSSLLDGDDHDPK